MFIFNLYNGIKISSVCSFWERTKNKNQHKKGNVL